MAGVKCRAVQVFNVLGKTSSEEHLVGLSEVPKIGPHMESVTSICGETVQSIGYSFSKYRDVADMYYWAGETLARFPATADRCIACASAAMSTDIVGR